MSEKPMRIDELMRLYGFNPDAPESTGRALIINMVRAAYGPDAAREFIRELNSQVKPDSANDQFKDSRVDSRPNDEQAKPSGEQLSFFNRKTS